MSSEIIFYTVIALFVAHELDAVRLREWQLLFVLRHQPDHRAYIIFVLLHVPIMVIFLWLNNHPSVQVRQWFQGAVDAFALIHVGLHWHLRNREQSGFQDRFSRNLILVLGLTGAVHGFFLLVSLA
jgi:NADH:ubiquinone oxidoreductase subunit 3 (subunit A)